MSNIKKTCNMYSIFPGLKGESVEWRCNLNELYQNWCKVAHMEQNLNDKESIKRFKWSLGTLKRAGSMITRSNQILDSFRNPEETIKVITNLAHSLNEFGGPSTEILNSTDNTPLRSLKMLYNTNTFCNKTNTGRCELLVYNSVLAFFCLNKSEKEKNQLFFKLNKEILNFLEDILTNFGNKKNCNKIAEKYIKFLKKIELYEIIKSLLGNTFKTFFQKDKLTMFKNTKEKSNSLKNLKSLYSNLTYEDYKSNCIDYWINYFYNNITNEDLDVSIESIKGAQEFFERCNFLNFNLTGFHNVDNLRGRIRDKISNFKNDELLNKESILTTDILNKLNIKTCIRPRYNQKKMWDITYESLNENINTCIINSSTMGSGKSVGSMLIPHIIKKIYKGKFAYIYTSYGDHLLGQHCDVLNFRENRGLMTPGALVISGEIGPEFYFWYEGCNLPSAKDIRNISSGSGKANKNSIQKEIDKKKNSIKKNVAYSRQIHKPFVFISDIESVPKLVEQLDEDGYKTILVVDEPPLSASKYLNNPDDKIMNNIMNCLTTKVNVLIMMCATQPELRHMPKFSRYLNNQFDRIVDVTEKKIAQSTKIMFNDKLILPHNLRNDDIFYDTISSPLNYRFYSLNSTIECFKKLNFNPNQVLLEDKILSISSFQTQIQNLNFRNEELLTYDSTSQCDMESLLNQIIINKPYKTGNQILWIENIDINRFESQLGDMIYTKCTNIRNILDLAIQKYGSDIPSHILNENPYGQFLRYMLENNNFNKLEKVFNLIEKHSWRFPPMKTIKYSIIDPNITDKMLVLLLNGIGFHYLKSANYYKCVKSLRDNNLLAIYIAPLELAFGTNMVLSAVVIEPSIAQNLSPDLIRQLTGRVSRGLTENPGLILSDINIIKKFLFERSPEAELMERFFPQTL